MAGVIMRFLAMNSPFLLIGWMGRVWRGGKCVCVWVLGVHGGRPNADNVGMTHTISEHISSYTKRPDAVAG